MTRAQERRECEERDAADVKIGDVIRIGHRRWVRVVDWKSGPTGFGPEGDRTSVTLIVQYLAGSCEEIGFWLDEKVLVRVNARPTV